MGLVKHTVNIAVTATGGATQSFETPSVVEGLLIAIGYRKSTASGISTAAGLTITTKDSSMVLLDATATGASGVPVFYQPRGSALNVSGVAINQSTAASSPIYPVYLPIAGEPVVVQVASGGAASAGDGLTATVDLYVQGR